MSASKHTPGSWVVGGDAYEVVAPSQTNNELDLTVVCRLFCSEGNYSTEAEEKEKARRYADANLIAAALELYVIATHPVLEHVLATSTHPSVKAILEPMRQAAVAKAEGRTP